MMILYHSKKRYEEKNVAKDQNGKKGEIIHIIDDEDDDGDDEGANFNTAT